MTGTMIAEITLHGAAPLKPLPEPVNLERELGDRDPQCTPWPGSSGRLRTYEPGRILGVA